MTDVFGFVWLRIKSLCWLMGFLLAATGAIASPEGKSADRNTVSPATVATARTSGTILVWGDSLSAAYGFAQAQGWPALLSAKLQASGFSHTVVNGSVAGETTAGGLARLPPVLAEHSPRIMLLALGANDGLRALSTAAMKTQLAQMIDLAQAQGATVLLFEMKIPPNYGPRYTQSFEAVYPELAQSTGAKLVPFFLADVALERTLMQADTIHPTAEAQPLLLERIWPVLESVLLEE